MQNGLFLGSRSSLLSLMRLCCALFPFSSLSNSFVLFYFIFPLLLSPTILPSLNIWKDLLPLQLADKCEEIAKWPLRVAGLFPNEAGTWPAHWASVETRDEKQKKLICLSCQANAFPFFLSQARAAAFISAQKKNNNYVHLTWGGQVEKLYDCGVEDRVSSSAMGEMGVYLPQVMKCIWWPWAGHYLSALLVSQSGSCKDHIGYSLIVNLYWIYKH